MVNLRDLIEKNKIGLPAFGTMLGEKMEINTFIGVDYGEIETRIVAHHIRERDLILVCPDGDSHCVICEMGDRLQDGSLKLALVVSAMMAFPAAFAVGLILFL